MNDKGFTNDAIPALSACESPVEGKLVQALFDAFRRRGLRPEYVSGGEIYKLAVEFTADDSRGSWLLGLQGRIPCLHGGRVDLVLIYREYSIDAGFAIEIDGAAYHGSPEQQRKDRIRDRALLSYGFPVLRYSGSELYGDTASLADGLLNLIQQQQENRWVDQIVAYEFGLTSAWKRHGAELDSSFEKFRGETWCEFVRGTK